MTFLEDLMTPSPRDEGPVSFTAFALGHAVLGAAAVQALGVWAWPLMPLYLAKEWWDIREGGTMADGAIDTAFVALGAAVLNPLLWLIAALAATAGRAIVKIKR